MNLSFLENIVYAITGKKNMFLKRYKFNFFKEFDDREIYGQVLYSNIENYLL